MRVLVRRGFCIGGGRDVVPGDVIDMEDRDALVKLQQGKVSLAEQDPYVDEQMMQSEQLDGAAVRRGRPKRDET